jgi:hypothetical protein
LFYFLREWYPRRGSGSMISGHSFLTEASPFASRQARLGPDAF